MYVNTAIIIACYNRPIELAECLETIKVAVMRFKRIKTVLLIDDASTDEKTKKMIREYSIPKTTIIKMFNRHNEGICVNLTKAYDLCFDNGHEVVMNFDSDAKVKPDIFEKLLELHHRFPDRIVTGFHSKTRNPLGLIRHEILYMNQEEGYCFKKTVGGINMVLSRPVYEHYLSPLLIDNYKHPGSQWDLQTCRNMNNDGLPAVCAVPSLVQHIAIHTTIVGHEDVRPDIAEDWIDLSLPNVTLVAIDEFRKEGVIAAALLIDRFIEFGGVKLFSNYNHWDEKVIKVKYPLHTKEDMASFIIEELYKYIDTEYVLLIQNGRYEINYKGWRDEFLEYDYVGLDNGFSLRSQKLMKTLATDSFIVREGPILIDRHRRYLEDKYQLKFAPKELAVGFSHEVKVVPEEVQAPVSVPVPVPVPVPVVNMPEAEVKVERVVKKIFDLSAQTPPPPEVGSTVFIRRTPPPVVKSRFLKAFSNET